MAYNNRNTGLGHQDTVVDPAKLLGLTLLAFGAVLHSRVLPATLASTP